MKFVQPFLFLFIALAAISSCKKGTLLEETDLLTIQLNKVFIYSPAIDVYVNGDLKVQLAAGEQIGKILVGENSTNINISLKKHDESQVLLDTTIAKVENGIRLTYLYDEQLGFNRFAGDDFKRPSQDSVAIQFVNNYTHGPQANIYIYKSPDGYSYNPADIVDSIKNLPLNQASKVITLPYQNADGRERILYTAIVEDAATGYNGTAEFCINNGLDPYTGWPLSDPSILETKQGKLTIVKTTLLPYNDGIKDYDMYSMELLLEY